MEIERKFLLSGFPVGLELKCSGVIEQGYISLNPEVRIRSRFDFGDAQKNFKLTVKSVGSLVRKEYETFVDEMFFNGVRNFIAKPFIVKDFRHYILPTGDVLEVCNIDKGSKDEFYYAEVEFESEEDAKNFIPLDCMIEEVTYDVNYKMKNYWSRTRLSSIT